MQTVEPMRNLLSKKLVMTGAQNKELEMPYVPHHSPQAIEY
jgi:hypothetical protein